MLIHRMIEFVIREGPMFEAMIMNREINNPMFRFLFENQSPAHVYYRWKLYSLLQGDLQLRWHTHEFRMFKGGSIWKPPPMHPYTQGMPDELVEGEEKEPRKGSLSNTQRDRLEDLLRNMTPERLKVAESMVFCIEHSEAADEICDCIAESLSILQTPIPKKIARLYLISDILHNCGVKITNASYYRKGLESRLLHVFQDVHAAYMSLESRLKAEGFKLRVMQMFRAWEEWAVYPKDFLIKLQNTFLGLTSTSDCKSHQESEGEEEPEARMESELDGMPMSGGEGEGEDLDGVPLDGAALLKGAMKHTRPLPTPDDDLDGVPMDDDIDGEPLSEDLAGDSANASNNKGKLASMPAGFVPSRWETVDPEQVEAQAMTTSKWDLLEQPEQHEQVERVDDLDSPGGDDSQEGDYQNYDMRDLNEDRRARLREIELKAVQYQDELECGQRTLKSGWSIQQQVEHYRRKLLRKAEKGEREKESERERTETDKDSQQDSSAERERQQGSGLSQDRRRRGDRESSRSERSSRRSSSPDDNYYHRTDRDSSSSRSKSKRSRSSSGSPVPSKRSYRSRSRSPVQSRKSARRSRSPHSKKSRGQSPPSPPRIKHRASSPPSPPRIKHRGSSPPSPPRIKRRGGSPPTPQRVKRRGSTSPSSPRSKHRGSSPTTPPRKHKHKHKY